MTSSEPWVSVIVATYQRAHSLGTALASLLDQTDPDWEALVVDDGSTDDTEAVVARYPDSRIRYLARPHRGLSRSREDGVENARARYITFLDSDDWFEPTHLEVRRRVLEADPGIELLHGGVEVLGEATVPDRHDPTRRIPLSECVIGATFVLARETFLSLGGYPDYDFGADAALFDRAVARNLRIHRIEDPTYVYDRRSADSICTEVGDRAVAARSSGDLRP